VKCPYCGSPDLIPWQKRGQDEILCVCDCCSKSMVIDRKTGKVIEPPDLRDTQGSMMDSGD